MTDRDRPVGFFEEDETPTAVLRAVPSRRRRLVSLGTRFLLGLACLALVSATLPVAMAVEEWRQQVSPQQQTPQAEFGRAELAGYREAAAAARPSAPKVLSYHDISPTPNGNPYVVTPQAFEAQMRMLAEAGYRTLTTDEFVRYLRGGSSPPRSVLITFDDGTHGLWTYADKILERYGFSAVAFIITDLVGTHRPYYLSWREIARMQESGRWDFGSHTSDLHHRIPVGESGQHGSALANRRYLEETGELEPLADYKQRVRADLEDSIRAMTGHGLPRPQLFAYPFSETIDAGGVNSAEADQFLQRELRRLFEAALVNERPHPGAVSRRMAASELVERGEIFTKTTAADLFGLLAEMGTLPVTGHDPAADPDRWLAAARYPAPVRTRDDGALTPDAGKETFLRAAYAPQRTADWAGYRVRTEVTDLSLREDRTATGAVSARVGSGSQIDVQVSSRSLQVSVRDGTTTRTALTQDLVEAASHEVEIRVGGQRTVVVVDGVVRYRQPVEPGPSSTGGIAVSAYRGSAGTDFPAFADMRVQPGG